MRSSAARGASALEALLVERGYTTNSRFNAMHGDKRRQYQGPVGKVDVFVGAFTMCHKLELEPRLAAESPTLTASDLVLTKLQIVELTEKDMIDLRLLMESHEVGSGPGDWIDADYIASVLAGIDRLDDLDRLVQSGVVVVDGVLSR